MDFVVYGPKTFCAIEVKNASKIRDQDLKGLNVFKSDFPQCSCYLLYRGKERLKKGNVLCLPCEEFLQAVVPGERLFAAEHENFGR